MSDFATNSTGETAAHCRSLHDRRAGLDEARAGLDDRRAGAFRRRAVATSVLVATAGVALVLIAFQRAQIRSDERVVLFPTFGSVSGAGWTVEVHGWVFEPEEDSAVRRAALDALRRLLGVDRPDAETGPFLKRASAFLVDNERGKRVSVRLGGQTYVAGVSEPNGHFRAALHVPSATVERLRDKAGWVEVETVLPEGDERRFTGRVHMIGSTGLSVISDIDDTIRVSHVLDRKALIESTFMREFEAVPGMADLYRRWADEGAVFHYVSGSPWQLYEPLAALITSAGYPAGTFHLRDLRLKDATAIEFLAAPGDAKRRQIERILATFPGRRFILVGDSGEQDPEIYGKVAREHTRQIERILIRDVTGQAADCARYLEAFAGLPAKRWQVFTEPDALIR